MLLVFFVFFFLYYVCTLYDFIININDWCRCSRSASTIPMSSFQTSSVTARIRRSRSSYLELSAARCALGSVCQELQEALRSHTCSGCLLRDCAPTSVLVYGSERWCLKKDERRILNAEMAWLRRLLCVTRRYRIRNDIVRSMLHQEESLVQKIRKRRLAWFGHVTRMEGERLPLRALLSYRRQKKSESTTKNMDVVH